MITYKKYAFRKYSKEFPILFRKEKSKLKKVLKNIPVEHVGSTAIPGLGGKGIIDIAIKTPKNKIKEFTRGLNSLGYIQTKEHNPNKDRIFFQKIIKSLGKERRVHIHLVLNNHYWNTFIAFRDYMIKNKKELEEYAKLKRKAVIYAENNGEKYRDYKNNFLAKSVKKALKEFGLK